MQVIADPINNTVNLITAICHDNGLPKKILSGNVLFFRTSEEEMRSAGGDPIQST